jgi:hypothetical protein
MLIKLCTLSCFEVRKQKNHNIRIDNISFENMGQLKDLGTIPRNKISCRKKIRAD